MSDFQNGNSGGLLVDWLSSITICKRVHYRCIRIFWSFVFLFIVWSLALVSARYIPESFHGGNGESKTNFHRGRGVDTEYSIFETMINYLISLQYIVHKVNKSQKYTGN